MYSRDVYSAIDTQLKRDVAIKVLRPELATEPVMRERFRREAEVVARLGRLRAEVERAVEGGGPEAMGAARRSAEACLRSADLAPPVNVSAPRDA